MEWSPRHQATAASRRPRLHGDRAGSPAGRPAAARDGLSLTDIKRSDLTLVPGKLAEPSDEEGPHPGSWAGWWYAHVMDRSLTLSRRSPL
ncbi:hypothetical protein GCM10009550_04400 [Actinocorallia libanotica]|uniref:Uncharacterized protein n=1 Tax=Actinocorallia libanotica TaxID=46162 RepID=A0ABN1Q4C9_9ACTN